MDGETLQQKTTHKGRNNTKLQDFWRQEGGGECIWNTWGEQVLLDTFRYYWAPWSKGQGWLETFFTCVLLHNMLRTDQGGADRAPNPANDVAAIQNQFFFANL